LTNDKELQNLLEFTWTKIEERFPRIAQAFRFFDVNHVINPFSSYRNQKSIKKNLQMELRIIMMDSLIMENFVE
jgi:hypothetical protein